MHKGKFDPSSKITAEILDDEVKGDPVWARKEVKEVLQTTKGNDKSTTLEALHELQAFVHHPFDRGMEASTQRLNRLKGPIRATGRATDAPLERRIDAKLTQKDPKLLLQRCHYLGRNSKGIQRVKATVKPSSDA